MYIEAWPEGRLFVPLREAAEIVGYTEDVIREAIRDGRLKAFIPGGRTPRTTGRGHGYQVTREALEAWYFGKE
jgi:hypothetical protein